MSDMIVLTEKEKMLPENRWLFSFPSFPEKCDPDILDAEMLRLGYVPWSRKRVRDELNRLYEISYSAGLGDCGFIFRDISPRKFTVCGVEFTLDSHDSTSDQKPEYGSWSGVNRGRVVRYMRNRHAQNEV